MKILEINAYYGYGSTGHIVKDLCEKGQLDGFEMYAIYWLKRKKSVENSHIIYCGEDKTPSTIVNAAYWMIKGGKLNYNSGRTESIIKQINIIRPDIIHLHNLHGDFEYGSIDVEMFFKAIAEYGCKIIWTLHDCWPITGRCYYFDYKKCTKWQNECGKCPQRLFDREGVLFDKSSINLKIKKKLYNNICEMKIITVSHWLENNVKKSILKERDVVTIYNGINTDVFKVDETVQEHNGILCIGWDRRKGFKDYIELAEMMPDMQVYVLGQRPFFRRHIKLPDNVREIGFISNTKEMAQLYNRMMIYFNASRAETFGLTTAEALGCGVPVVGYNNTATPEIVDSYGICVEDKNVNQIAEAIRELKAVDDGVTRNNRSKYAHDIFSKKLMLENYLEIFKEC